MRNDVLRRGLLLALMAAACFNPERDRLKETTKPSYDPATGRLKELTYDANEDGRIDTWTEMDGTRPIRARIDRDEDGKLDRWEYYDETSTRTILPSAPENAQASGFPSRQIRQTGARKVSAPSPILLIAAESGEREGPAEMLEPWQ